MMFTTRLSNGTFLIGLVSVVLLWGGEALAGGGFAKAGWTAVFELPTQHFVTGTATIIDETTVEVTNFSYDGLAPLVYFYLGVSNTNDAFLNGLRLDPLLDRAYDNETVLLTLPAGESMDNWLAISVWCDEFDVSFASNEFSEPGAVPTISTWGLIAITLLILVAATAIIRRAQHGGPLPLRDGRWPAKAAITAAFILRRRLDGVAASAH